jgi:hypothetical protein
LPTFSCHAKIHLLFHRLRQISMAESA